MQCLLAEEVRARKIVTQRKINGARKMGSERELERKRWREGGAGERLRGGAGKMEGQEMGGRERGRGRGNQRERARERV
jgi:hypothetical protein